MLYVRQQAWLNTAPVPVGPVRRGGKAPEPVSRRAKLEADGREPLMPPVGEFGHMLEYWRDIGFFLAGGMGRAPLSAQEVLAWQNGTQTPLTPWEFQALLDASRRYVEMLKVAEDATCLPPFGAPVQEVDREALSKTIGSAFRSAIAARKKARQ